MIPLFRLAAVYFLLVFAAGFALGPIRVLFLEPRLGVRSAELLEMPVMLAVIYCAARFTVRRLGAKVSNSGLIQAGLLALGGMLGAEIWVGISLRGQTLSELFLDRDPVSGGAYYAALAVFAAMPRLVKKRRQ